MRMRRIRDNMHYIKKNQRYINIHHKFIIIEFDTNISSKHTSIIYLCQRSGQCRTELWNQKKVKSEI